MKKETLKVWCDEKVEKGKKWFENHKFEAGYVSGILAMLAAYRIVVDKVFEPKQVGLQTLQNANPDSKITTGIRMFSLNRFGGQNYEIEMAFDADETRQIVQELLDTLPETNE